MSDLTRILLFRMDDADGAVIQVFDDGGHSDHLRLYVEDTLAYLAPAQAAELSAQLARLVGQRMPKHDPEDEPVVALMAAGRAVRTAHVTAAERRDPHKSASRRSMARDAVRWIDEAITALGQARRLLSENGGETR